MQNQFTITSEGKVAPVKTYNDLLTGGILSLEELFCFGSISLPSCLHAACLSIYIFSLLFSSWDKIYTVSLLFSGVALDLQGFNDNRKKTLCHHFLKGSCSLGCSPVLYLFSPSMSFSISVSVEVSARQTDVSL